MKTLALSIILNVNCSTWASTSFFLRLLKNVLLTSYLSYCNEERTFFGLLFLTPNLSYCSLLRHFSLSRPSVWRPGTGKGSVQTSHFTRAESKANERKQLMFFNGNKFGTCELRRRRLNRDLIRWKRSGEDVTNRSNAFLKPRTQFI